MARKAGGNSPASTAAFRIRLTVRLPALLHLHLLTGGGPDGATASPVLLMYQRGLQQGHPDEAAAIGVILIVPGSTG